jgi:protein PsiE
MHDLAQALGNLLTESFGYLVLSAIYGITARASVVAFLGMLENGHITVDGIYLRTSQPYLTQFSSRSTGWKA